MRPDVTEIDVDPEPVARALAQTSAVAPPAAAATPLRLTPAWRDRALIVLFITTLFCPLAILTLRLESTVGMFENRAKQPFPRPALTTAALNNYPRQFRNWWQDNFGGRGMLIRWNARLRVQMLGLSTDLVVVGKDGWYYYDDYGSIESYRAVDLMSPAYLDAWRTALQDRHDWLAQRGTRYYYYLAPGKATIYPEYLPQRINRVGEQSRLDQLMAEMRRHSTVNMLDMRPALLAAKADGLQYYKTDTHWNLRGSAVAAAVVGQALQRDFPAVQPLDLTQCTIEQAPYCGDLMGMLALHQLVFESQPIVIPPQGILATEADLVNGMITITRTDAAARDLPTGLCVGDSFMMKQIPYLAVHFRKMTFYWCDYLDPQWVKDGKPDVVVQELVERRLTDYWPLNPAEISGHAARQPVPPKLEDAPTFHREGR